MKLVVGPIPEDTSFDPAATGWHALREPHPVWINLIAIPVAVVVFAAGLLVIKSFTPIAMKFVMTRFVVAFLLIIPLHEVIHALFHPRLGTTRQTLLGCWPTTLLFYAHFEGELTRERFLAMLLAPFMIITFIPLAVISIFSLESPWLAAIALANGIGASGDLIGVFIVLTQVPRGVIVRNKGWRTYWRIGERASRPQ